MVQIQNIAASLKRSKCSELKQKLPGRQQQNFYEKTVVAQNKSNLLRNSLLYMSTLQLL